MTQKTKSILLVEIVEDDKLLQSILAEQLEKSGFKVITAKDGEKGLELALNDHPDLVLLDIIMPNMDGITMLKKLREDKRGKNIPVVVLSNLSNPETIAEALMGQAFDYMVKAHCEPKDIVNKVKEKLGVA